MIFLGKQHAVAENFIAISHSVTTVNKIDDLTQLFVIKNYSVIIL